MFTLKTVKISRNPILLLYNSNNYANFAIDFQTLK